MQHRDADLVLGTWNTHVGLGLEHDGLDDLLEAAPHVHVWALQEVRRIAQLRSALRRAGALRDFKIVPGDGYDDARLRNPNGRLSALPYFLVQRGKRFDVEAVLHPNVTFGGQYGRRALVLELADHRTGRDVVLGNVHVNPLGRGFAKANPGARSVHEKQVAAYARLLNLREHEEGAVRVALGDFNESLGARVQLPEALRGRDARARMRAVGLQPAFLETGLAGSRAVRLDDVFANFGDDYVRAKRRRVIKVRRRGVDHDAVVVRLGVKAAS